MDQGHERAAVRLGSIYLYGEYGANKDYTKARECFEKAPGESKALRLLGDMVGFPQTSSFTTKFYVALPHAVVERHHRDGVDGGAGVGRAVGDVDRGEDRAVEQGLAFQNRYRPVLERANRF